ncbi:MAG: hypothetical protein IKU25_03010 [Clostridia bacterium]|nr:hypothetical protein [Clostridia bacterium]
MDEIFEKTSFFLESYTPDGLCSFYDELYDPDTVRKAYLITGGISSVTSMLVKLVADNVEQRGFCAQRISNPLCTHQLDGAYFPQLNTCISNGGERGVVATKYPVATEEICSLSDCFDADFLRENSQDMKRLFNECEGLKKRAVGFMAAAQALMNDSKEIARKYMNTEKMFRYASRLARREFPFVEGRQGREYKRFLSSITSNGVETYSRTLENICERFYVYCDRYGAVSGFLMELIKNYALTSGYDVISCYCTMSGGCTVEHLIVPELKLCFFSDRVYHSADFTDKRKVNFVRFTDVKALSEYKKRLSFNRKGVNEMFGEAIKLLDDADNVQKRLDFIYFSCLDKVKFSCVADRITAEILKI